MAPYKSFAGKHINLQLKQKTEESGELRTELAPTKTQRAKGGNPSCNPVLPSFHVYLEACMENTDVNAAKGIRTIRNLLGQSGLKDVAPEGAGGAVSVRHLTTFQIQRFCLFIYLLNSYSRPSHTCDSGQQHWWLCVTFL